jgi:hypothetical protein
MRPSGDEPAPQIADDQAVFRRGSALCSSRSRTLRSSARPRWVAGDRARASAHRVAGPRMSGLEATRHFAGPGIGDPVDVLVLTTFGLDDAQRPASTRCCRLVNPGRASQQS